MGFFLVFWKRVNVRIAMPQKTFVIIVTVIVLGLLIPAGYALWNISRDGAFSPSANAVSRLDDRAFGNLSGATATGLPDGKGSEQQLSGLDRTAIEPYLYEPTVYVYTFDGDLAPYLGDAHGTVYERQAFGKVEGSALRTIASSFSSLQLDPFLSGELTSFALKAGEYALSIDAPGNTWTIYQDWTNTLADYLSSYWQPLEASDLPSDETIITLARDFAQRWGVTLDGSRDPVIAEPEVALARAGSTEVYIPETVTVVFPRLIEEQQAYPSWGSAPTGLRISVNLRDMRVTHAYDALTQSYNASSYTLTQNADLLSKLIAGGGTPPAVYEDVDVKEVLVPLNAPERVLMEYTLYENGRPRMLFVPALRFTLQDPSLVPWSSGVVTVPLVAEIAEEQKRMQEIDE